MAPENLPPTSSLRGALTLGAFALVCSALVAGTHQLTRERISINEREQLLQRFDPVLGNLGHDDIAVDAPILIHAPGILPGDGNAQIFAVYDRGSTAGFAFAVTTIGYAGAIRLLVGIDVAGRLTGVRVLSHSETPGLGDKIDTQHSDWVLGFSGRTLFDPPAAQWKIRRDGGSFDQFTGASVTPRAVVAAIRQCLLYYADHRDELLEASRRTAGNAP